MKNIMRKAINSILKPLDLEINAKTKGYRRMSMQGALNQIAELHFIPRTVIDVGAAFGDWSKMCNHFFPDAHYFLFEPLQEYKDVLNKITSEFDTAQYFPSAVGSKNGTVILNVHEDLVGSSMFRETEGAFTNGKPRTVPMVTLDKIALDYDFRGPYLIKIDTQGAELEVLSGADKILKQTEYIILEVSLFQFMIGGPQIFDVIRFMKERGFVVYDVISYLYRPLDNALAQFDVSFVRENGMFRKDHRYSTREQREEQNKRFKEKNRGKLESQIAMNKKILYVFRGNTQKRILDKPEEKGPYDFLYGFNHLKKDFDCNYIIAPRGKRSSLIEKLLYLPEKPFNILTKLGLPLDIYPLFKKELKQADNVFCINDGISLGILFYKMLGLIDGKIIVLMMSLPERLKYFRKHKLLISFISRLLTYADTVMTLSDYAQKPLIETFNVSPKKLKTFYFGVDANYWKHNPNSERKNFVLSVGNDMNRDYNTLVNAIPDDLDLVIVTSKKVNTKGKPNIKIISGISDSELRDLYQSCMVTVIPSIKVEYESSGLSSTLQAMACGSPVLISDAPTLREYFAEDEHIHYYEPGNSLSLKNKLLQIMNTYEESLNIAEQANTLVSNKFTTKNMEKSWLRILNDYKKNED